MSRHYRGLALALLLAGAPAAGAEDAVVFRFAPADGETWTVTTKTEARLELGEDGARGASSQGLTATSRLTARRVEGGWAVEETAVSLAATRNGEPAPDPVSGMMQGLSVTYDLDAEGRVKAVRGFGTLVERLKAAFPPEVISALGPAAEEPALARRTSAEWAGRIGDFAGKTVRIGETWESASDFPLPDGRVLGYTVRTTFAERVACGERSCVRITFVYDGKAEGGLGIAGEGERIVEPDTLRIRSESTGRTILVDMEVPGEGRVRATRHETRSSAYTYGISPAGP